MEIIPTITVRCARCGGSFQKEADTYLPKSPICDQCFDKIIERVKTAYESRKD